MCNGISHAGRLLLIGRVGYAPSWHAIAARASSPLLVRAATGRLTRDPLSPFMSQAPPFNDGEWLSDAKWSASHMWTSWVGGLVCDDVDFEDIEARFDEELNRDDLEDLDELEDLDLSL